MTISRKTLAAAGFLAISALPLSPAVASADTPSMYDTCSAEQQGRDITTADGDTLRCVNIDSGSGYYWEEPN
ncbi:hypothetical protein [Tsukamurella hominis]|uniref:hypothetical protein n=1 Tax=Tsukamurella hominis TaxID=1970232 RepID=UPI0039E88F9A